MITTKEMIRRFSNNNPRFLRIRIFMKDIEILILEIKLAFYRFRTRRMKGKIKVLETTQRVLVETIDKESGYLGWELK